MEPLGFVVYSATTHHFVASRGKYVSSISSAREFSDYTTAERFRLGLKSSDTTYTLAIMPTL